MQKHGPRFRIRFLILIFAFTNCLGALEGALEKLQSFENRSTSHFHGTRLTEIRNLKSFVEKRTAPSPATPSLVIEDEASSDSTTTTSSTSTTSTSTTNSALDLIFPVLFKIQADILALNNRMGEMMTKEEHKQAKAAASVKQ